MDQQELNFFFQRLITLFRPRDDRALWVGECGTRWLILAWSRTDLSALQLTNDGSLESYITQLKEAMRGGGLIVTVEPQAETLTASSVNGPNYYGPKNMLGFDVDGLTKTFKLDTSIKYDKGDHFLIPVDEGAGRILGQLEENLHYLTPDQERNIYNLIGRPSLQLRMQGITSRVMKLEDQLAKSRSHRNGAAATSAPAIGTTFFRRQSRPLVIALAVALVVVLVIGFGWYFDYFEHFGLFGPSTPSPFESEVSSLLSALAKTESTTIQSLYKTDRLAQLRDESATKILKSVDFANAVLELELVRAGLLQETDLKSPFLPSESASILNRNLPKFKDSRKMIGYVSCQASNKRITSIIEGACISPDYEEEARIKSAFEVLIKFVSTPEDTLTVVTSPFESDARDLLKAMHDSKDPIVRSLYNDLELSRVLEKGHSLEERSFAPAVVKLELFRLGLLTKASTDLKGNIVVDSERVFEEHPALVKQGKSVLLGYVCCRAFGYPGLSRGLSIPGEDSCKTPDENHMKLIKDGFARLIKFASEGR